MVHAVGLLGANGLVGGATVKHLAESANAGTINLVVLHRAGNAPKGLPPSNNIEFRTIDLEGSASDLDRVVKGINILISAIASGALALEPKIVEALAKSPDAVTYIPSSYSTTWNKEDEADSKLGPVLSILHGGSLTALERKLPTTVVYTGVFANYLFDLDFLGSSIKRNTLWANKQQLRNVLPITPVEYLAHVLHELAISDPHSIKNTEHAAVAFWPTGQELADLYLKVNGKPTSIKDYTQASHDELVIDVAHAGPVKAGYLAKWACGNWEYEDKIEHKGYAGPGLEDLARQYVV